LVVRLFTNQILAVEVKIQGRLLDNFLSETGPSKLQDSSG